jgi:arginyl-tRNA synthetase
MGQLIRALSRSLMLGGTMNNEEIVVLMNKFVDMKSQISLLEADKKKLIAEAMPKDVRDKVEEIEDEFAGKSEQAQKDLEKLEEEIKAGIVSLQKTLAVKGMKAFYYEGKVSWDAKGLEGVVKNNPEIAGVISKFKKQGKPYAAFRFES